MLTKRNQIMRGPNAALDCQHMKIQYSLFHNSLKKMMMIAQTNHIYKPAININNKKSDNMQVNCHSKLLANKNII